MTALITTLPAIGRCVLFGIAVGWLVAFVVFVLLSPTALTTTVVVRLSLAAGAVLGCAAAVRRIPSHPRTEESA